MVPLIYDSHSHAPKINTESPSETQQQLLFNFLTFIFPFFIFFFFLIIKFQNNWKIKKEKKKKVH